MKKKKVPASQELGFLPVSKPDAAERSGSISADEQTQVAV